MDITYPHRSSWRRLGPPLSAWAGSAWRAFAGWLGRAWQRRLMSSEERYLYEARDLADLEWRLKAIQRGDWAPRIDMPWS
jgi:hypothetical protein